MQAENIKLIKFGVLSPEQIKRLGVLKITVPDTYNEDGYPIDGGLVDQKMGVIDPGLICKTCGAKAKVCPGHFGYLDLVRPAIHSEFSKVIYLILNSVCQNCSRVLFSDEELEEMVTAIKESAAVETPMHAAINTENMALPSNEIKIEANDEQGKEKEMKGAKAKESRTKELVNAKSSKEKTTALKKLKDVRKCPHCDFVQKKLKFEAPTYFTLGDRKLKPDEIKDMLSSISDADLRNLEIDPKTSRPEWLILSSLLVPPVNVRPSVTLETGERSEDDLTHKLVDVIRINQRLEQNINAGAPPIIIDDLWELLQYHINTYFKNETSGIPPARHRSGRALKTLAQRLKGKEGRFRYNLSGKRVNFSARTVISVDPYIDLNQVGVPKEIASKLTVPFYVTEWNIEEAKRILSSEEYPTALNVIAKDGKRKRVTETNRKELLDALSPGDIIERQLMDDDIVIFNRQPSLHRMSMMAHRVKVVPGKSFRMNFCVTHPYNADFDGDEMNLHIPQTLEAQAEARYLMAVNDQVFSPRDGEAIISGDEDDITGLHLLTMDDTEVTKEETLYLLGSIGIFELPKQKKAGIFSGKAIFSMLLPKGMDIEQKTRHGIVRIKDGELVEGTITKDTYKGKSKILAYLAVTYGMEELTRFIGLSARLADAYVTLSGSTVGIKEYRISKKIAEEKENAVRATMDTINKLVEQYRKRKLEPLLGYTRRQSLEKMILAELTKLTDLNGEIIMKHTDPQNHAFKMVSAGSRGSIFNFVQMSMLLGQQSTMSGGRIKRGYMSGRVLPHMRPKSVDPISRGFVLSNFYSGLTPIDLYMHAIGSRTSVVYKALLTARSGYLQRRLMNALQDYYIYKDKSVRDTYGNIIETIYAGDGIDPMKVLLAKLGKK